VIRITYVLARRALRNSFRRPQFLAPLVIFPTMFLAVNTGGLSATTRLPGFPVVHGFLDFQLAAAMTQSLLLGGVSAGVAMAIEIEGGFFDRLTAAPVPRIALVLGRLVATGVLAMAQVTWFLAIGLIFGAHIHGGVPGVLLILIIGAIAGVAFGGIGVTLALRARNASTVQGIFPIVFVILFVSSAFFPSNLLEQPAKALADYNPLSYIADGLRDPIISAITAKTVLEGMAAGAAVALVMVWLAVRALRGKLAT
jgi:ABC-type multidrug transport system permease subunit